MVLGLSFLWKKFYSWRYFRKGISSSSLDRLPEVVFFTCGTKPHHVEMAYETLSLKRVFSPHLNTEKHWYALNSFYAVKNQLPFVPPQMRIYFLRNISSSSSMICVVKMELRCLSAGFANFRAARKFTWHQHSVNCSGFFA